MAETFVDYVLTRAGQEAIAGTGWQPVRATWLGSAGGGPIVTPSWPDVFNRQDELLNQIPGDLRWLSSQRSRRPRWPAVGIWTAGLVLALLVLVPLFELFRGAIGEGWAIGRRSVSRNGYRDRGSAIRCGPVRSPPWYCRAGRCEGRIRDRAAVAFRPETGCAWGCCFPW